MSRPPAVDQLTRRDERTAVATLSAAFADYVLLTALCPDPERRRRVAWTYSRLLFRMAAVEGGAFATADRAAVVCALPPRREWPTPWAFVCCGAVSLGVHLRPRAALQMIRIGVAFDEARERHLGARPHWYVHLLGVRPGAQGRGLARAVLAPVFAAADRSGVPVYLETMPEANVPIYQKLGFALVGLRELPGGLPNHELVREPAPGVRRSVTG
ncbi:Acetyltransferase (GNAT) family protein [Gemmata obscuriglobus]|nr:GNAT family N-acetyltransferase [Gemmata obscuriglobus]QEG27374.1 Acetyltransferase (GNAT) family protein [Gemmata obscuriglobus]VTS04263.1 acetyltransferase : GCN5-related N-acetyltransferase OS=Dehalogenimonas lykanthroporepellens (strain ATCC BAA-1523 / JCM 15061 / BL-DC-9) GN=Dehly_1393 PE=4 SV=1: Acetyltransf_1 [Gemmata obscuriglobus UQM 2246]